MHQPNMGGGSDDSDLRADFKPSREASPDVAELVAQQIQRIYQETGQSVPIVVAELHQWLNDNGIPIGRNRLHRVLNDLVDQKRLTRTKAGGQIFRYQPGSYQPTFSMNMRSRSASSSPAVTGQLPGSSPVTAPLAEEEPSSSPAVPQQLSGSSRPVTGQLPSSSRPVTGQLPACPDHGSGGMRLLRNSKQYRCSVRVPVDDDHPRGYCDWPADIVNVRDVNPVTLNVNIGDGDVNAGGRGGYIESAMRRHGFDDLKQYWAYQNARAEGLSDAEEMVRARQVGEEKP